MHVSYIVTTTTGATNHFTTKAEAVIFANWLTKGLNIKTIHQDDGNIALVSCETGSTYARITEVRNITVAS